MDITKKDIKIIFFCSNCKRDFLPYGDNLFSFNNLENKHNWYGIAVAKVTHVCQYCATQKSPEILLHNIETDKRLIPIDYFENGYHLMKMNFKGNSFRNAVQEYLKYKGEGEKTNIYWNNSKSNFMVTKFFSEKTLDSIKDLEKVI